MNFKIIKTDINVESKKLKLGWSIELNDLVFIEPMRYEVLDESIVDGKRWFSVQVNDEIVEWLLDTFILDVDFVFVHHLKGVWVDMPERVFVLLKLKWTK